MESKVIRTTNEFLSIFRAARRVSTPLICARTADPASALGLIQESLNGKAESVPVTVWDILSGLRPVNAAAKENLCRVLDERDPSTVGPARCARAGGWNGRRQRPGLLKRAPILA